MRMLISPALRTIPQCILRCTVLGTNRFCAHARAALLFYGPLRAISLCALRAMLGYFLVSVARNLLLHCSSVLRVSREGGKYSLHGKTLRWRIVLCAVTNLLRAAHILAGTTQCLCPNPRRIRTRV